MRRQIIQLILRMIGARDATDQLGRVQKAISGVSGVVGALKAALIALGIQQIISSLFRAGTEIQALNRSMVAVTGSTEKAAEELSWLRSISDELGQEFYTLADSYKGFLAATQDTNMAGKASREVFVAVMEAATALGMSVDDVEGSYRALIQMVSKGNVQAEELRGQLGERLYGAFNLAAEAMGLTTQELNKMLERGEVLAEDLLPRLARVLHDKYGKAARDAANDGRQAVNRFTTAWKDLKAEMASGGFLDAATEALNSFSDVIKDPKFQEGMKELIGYLAELIRLVAELAKSDFVRAIPKAVSETVKNIKENPQDLINPTGIAIRKLLGTKPLTPQAAKEEENKDGRVVDGQFRYKIEKQAETKRNDDLFSDPIEPFKPKKKPLSEEALLKDSLRRANATADTHMALLDSMYKQGQISLEKYFKDRQALIVKQHDIEAEALKKLAEAETDPTKRMSLETDLFELQQKHRQDMIGLIQGQAMAEEQLAKTSAQSMDAAWLTRVQEQTKTALAILDSEFNRGQVSIQEYFAQRRQLIEAASREEIALLQKQLAGETDINRKRDISSKILVEEETLRRSLIQLTDDQASAEQRLAQQREEAQRMLDQMNARATMPDAGTGLDSTFQYELTEMDSRHAEEIRRLEELNATKEQIEDAYRAQKLEKERLLVDQEKRLHESRLEMAETIAGGMAEAFEGLYELTGKKHKEFFYLAKAAALAEATMRVAGAVLKAYEQFGAYGAVAAAVVAAAGAVEIATISSQTLASGGKVQGWSPTDRADNIPIMGTAGEWMIQRPTTRYYGEDIMAAFNQGMFPKDALEDMLTGPVTSPPPSFHLASGGPVPEVPQGAMGMGDVSIPLTINNVLDSTELLSVMGTPQGGHAVYNVMASDVRKFQKLLQRGS
ncbi:tape measure protein [Desulfosarcina sp. OttesenSCG-928-B08]|nr:tape measure protein [Desulfosarcina sp. OttesenSCG-928-B08]